jgi:uncharacterized protein (TIGR00730 family)
MKRIPPAREGRQGDTLACMTDERRKRYELGEADLDQKIEALIATAEAHYGAASDTESVRQIVVSALRLLRDGTPRGDLKLLNSALKELRHAFRVFAPYRAVRKVAVFGSARITPDQADWKQAFAFAERIVAEGWMIITGAGDGIMGAAQGGAGRAASFGVNIRLPFEQNANPTIAGDSKLINFRYFFTRKIAFVKEAHAIALFPGGFGTHDEGFESLTLIQTGKSEILPVVFIDAPGGSYWAQWRRYLEEHLRERGLISPEDFALFRVTDDVDDAMNEILHFYANYQSSRYVRDLLVIRLREAPDEGQLELLNHEFSSIVKGGRIEVAAPLPEEGREMAGHPRLTLRFNRRDVGRLRQLIDRLNDFVDTRAATPLEASPHEIVAEPFSPETLAGEADED